MLIKVIVIEGTAGDVEITNTETGAQVTAAIRVICEVNCDEDREARYAKARDAAKVLLGTDRRGGPAGTNSMVHDVLDEIDRVAGC